MLSNKLAFAALATACIAAAAGGGYLASRQNTVPARVAATSAAPASTPVEALAGPAERPVQETEAVVGDTPAKPAPSMSQPSLPPAPRTARRNDVPARPSPRENRSASGEPPTTLTSSWPSSANTQAASAPPSTPAPVAEALPGVEERPGQESAATAEAPSKTFEELVVSADSVIGLQNETRVTTETARVEDRVEARVTRDVKVGDRVAIPAGARAVGNVTQVERGGKFKERAKLGIRFHTLVLADGTRIPISTETIYREGDSPGNSSAQKIGGGAVGGAILGAILGGAKGAAIGATAGACRRRSRRGRRRPQRRRAAAGRADHRSHPLARHGHHGKGVTLD